MKFDVYVLIGEGSHFVTKFIKSFDDEQDANDFIEGEDTEEIKYYIKEVE